MVNRLFEAVDHLVRKPSVAQIGGFRPEEDRKSWFGGHFLPEPGDTWPVLDGAKAVPVIQICVTELPVVPAILEGKEILQIFLSQAELPIDLPAENGDRFLVRELPVEGVEQAPDAPSFDYPRPFQIKWLEGKPEGPVWEEVCYYVDFDLITEHVERDDPFSRYNDRYFGHSGTKVGGWPTYIEGLAQAPENYVIQVSSEPKPRFGIGDSGNMYFYLSSAGDWSMSWDCY
jgi:hypothetical protein